MVDTLASVNLQTPEYPVRKVNVERDLGEIANLIELCFGEQMDEDGHEYLRQIRRAAKDSRQIIWVRGSNEWVAMPLHGYIYQDGERIIGNVTLVPYRKAGQWIYLICNVAVHPDFRRQGIGRLMTLKGLEHIRRQKAQAAWLQVRDDNQPAIHLYETLGFQRRAVRTLWRAYADQPIGGIPSGLTIRQRKAREWPIQKEWLGRTYPEEVAWNLNFRLQAFRPGFWHWLYAWIQGSTVENKVAIRDGKPVGAVSWQETTFHQEFLWPVLNRADDDETLAALLGSMRRQLSTHRPIVVNFPAGQAENGFYQAGFDKVNTLIWMESPLD